MTDYPITLIWPAGARVATINGQWQRLEDGRIEANYQSKDQLALALLFKDLEPGKLRLSALINVREGNERPGGPCLICGAEAWWEREADRGGGWLCGRCHPDPKHLCSQEQSEVTE